MDYRGGKEERATCDFLPIYLNFFRILLRKTSEKYIYRQYLMLTQTELVSRNSKCKWRGTKTGDRGQEKGSKGQGPSWLALYIRPADLAEGVWAKQGGPDSAQKALKGRNSHV
jgi:hypothetical protein